MRKGFCCLHPIPFSCPYDNFCLVNYTMSCCKGYLRVNQRSSAPKTIYQSTYLSDRLYEVNRKFVLYCKVNYSYSVLRIVFKLYLRINLIFKQSQHPWKFCKLDFIIFSKYPIGQSTGRYFKS